MIFRLHVPALAMLALTFTTNLLAQPISFGDFGAITGEEIDIRNCPFDPASHAVILRRDARVFPAEQSMVTQVRIRIKILDDKGLDAANVKLRYYSFDHFEKIEDITATTFNYDAIGGREEARVQPRDIYDKHIDGYYSEVSFAMPGVRKGSIIEYAYSSIRASYKIVDYWYLQQDIPVLHSTFDYTVLPNSEFSYRVLKSPEFEVKVRQDNALGKISFAADNLPGLPDEPFMDSRRDNLQRVELQMNFAGYGLNQERYAATWPELTSILLKDEGFGLLLDHPIPGTQDLLKEARAIGDPERRMDYLFRAVRSRMSWDNYIGIMSRDRLKVPWDTRKGSLAEINLILINLLRNADLHAEPILASDRGHGHVDVTHPFVQQFNKVIARVSLNGHDYYLDGSDITNSVGLVPLSLLNTTGYLVTHNGSRFVTIADRNREAKEFVNMEGKIGEDAVLNGDALLSSISYCRVEPGTMIRESQTDYVKKNLEDSYEGFSVEGFSTENLSSDTLPLEQHLKYRFRLPETNGYYQLPLNLLSGMSLNPFSSQDRYSDINFGFNRSLSVSQALELPTTIVAEDVPKNTMLMLPDTSLSLLRQVAWNAETRKFTVRLRFECRRSVFTREQYPMVREFYRKMFAILQEPLVLRKKATP
jgi:hypothetical protein